MRFSIVIPVYNRPDELRELLQSISKQKGSVPVEVVIVEDGSTLTSESVVNQSSEYLKINYCFKNNSGPGDSRNYGMKRSSGDYFLLLDSDCLLPEDYLVKVSSALDRNFTDAFGGPDAAHPEFSWKQKAFNYAMTSLLSTGGIRSSETEKRKFQLRSFNMGLSSRAFELTGGFGKQRIGEDIDLNFRLAEKGCSTQFLPEAFVYHKRRATWIEFFKQTRNFGAARPVLNQIHPGTSKFTYVFPSLFVLGLTVSVLLSFFGYPYFFDCLRAVFRGCTPGFHLSKQESVCGSFELPGRSCAIPGLWHGILAFGLSDEDTGKIHLRGLPGHVFLRPKWT